MYKLKTLHYNKKVI